MSAAAKDGKRVRLPIDAVLVIAVAVVLGPLVAPLTGQPACRLALTGALADRHTVDVDGYTLGPDHSVYGDRLLCDKAPGQPVLAVPFYALARAAGFDPAIDRRITENLTLWWVTIWSALVPLAAVLVMMRRRVARFMPARAVGVAVGLVAGTVLMPMSVTLFGHVLPAALAFGTWWVAGGRGSPRRLLLAGLLAGAAIFVEYETVIVAAVVGAFVLWRWRSKVVWFALGSVPGLAALGTYHTVAVGAPWRLPHHYWGGDPAMRSEYTGFRFPGPEEVMRVLVGPRGVAITMPIVLVAVALAVGVARRAGPARTEAVVSLAIAVPYLVVAAAFRGTPHLEEPGFRFIIPAIPFLAVPLAVGWDTLRLYARAAMGYGVIVMSAATFTSLLIVSTQWSVPEHIELFFDRSYMPTLWSMMFGSAGGAVYVASAGAAIAWVWSRAREAQPEPAGAVSMTR